MVTPDALLSQSFFLSDALVLSQNVDCVDRLKLDALLGEHRLGYVVVVPVDVLYRLVQFDHLIVQSFELRLALLKRFDKWFDLVFQFLGDVQLHVILFVLGLAFFLFIALGLAIIIFLVNFSIFVISARRRDWRRF